MNTVSLDQLLVWRLPLLVLLIVLLMSTVPVSFVRAAGVVGTGTPQSCTEAALEAALKNGGTVTFNCGATPHTITVRQAKVIVANTSLDGGDRITLSGGGKTRLFDVRSGASLSLQAITVRDGYFADGPGGGIFSAGRLSLTRTTLANNCALGGGGVYSNGPALTIVDSTFTGNNANTEDCPGDSGGTIKGRSNGGAVAVINPDGTASITGSTFSRNRAFAGGAVASTTRLTVSNSIFDSNTAPSSGGASGAIESVRDLIVRESSFTNNSSGFIGGAITQNGYTLTVSTSTFFGNTSATGGAIMNAGGNATVSDSSFANNAAGLGGAINSTFGPLAVSGSTFAANSAPGGDGGAINTTNVLGITNSTFSANTAKYGGGINSFRGTVALRSSTFQGNSATSTNDPGGGGVRNHEGTLDLKNVIVAGSVSGGNCTGTINSLGSNLSSDRSCKFDKAGDMNTIDPMLGPLQNNSGPTRTHALVLSSPARDHGAGCPAFDQRGVARPKGRACDIGAVEFNGQIYTVNLPLIIR